MNERNKPAEVRRRPPRDHAGKPRDHGERTTWHRPSYRVVEASMEVSAYFLADR
ncbi:hypothetical protein ACFQ08_14235 [Streptosporangium algeriense]|uniref:Coenzyme PQQ synthesis protein A n=1 Tax=Streptosporangium algeriense TaxID=1682748 RepID=A0ABW3DPH0_9ACTN